MGLKGLKLRILKVRALALKILRCQVLCNKRVGWGNELLGSFLGFIFLLFPIKVAQGQACSSLGKDFYKVSEIGEFSVSYTEFRLTFSSL